jgi:hypothetical protein
MKITSTETMIRRLELLERRRSRSLWAGAAYGAFVMAVVWGGTSVARIRHSVEAEQFLLRDKQGNVRARLALRPDGAPAFALLDPRGKERIRLQSTSDGTASMEFYHNSRVQLVLSSNSQGDTAINFFNAREGGYCGLYVWSDGTAGLSVLRNQHGVQMAAQPDGVSGLAIVDSEGRTTGRLGLPEGVDAQAFLNGQGGLPFRRPGGRPALPGMPARPAAAAPSARFFPAHTAEAKD